MRRPRNGIVTGAIAAALLAQAVVGSTAAATPQPGPRAAPAQAGAFAASVSSAKSYTGAQVSGLSVTSETEGAGPLLIEPVGVDAAGAPTGWRLSGAPITAGKGCVAEAHDRLSCGAADAVGVELGAGGTASLVSPGAARLRRVNIVSSGGPSHFTLNGPFAIEFLRVFLGAGDDRLELVGLPGMTQSWVRTGAGDDSTTAVNVSKIRMEAGRDTCVCAGIGDLSMGSGDDRLNGNTFARVALREGNDEMVVTPRTPGIDMRPFPIRNAIGAGDGDDVFRLDPRLEPTARYRLAGGRGDDTFFTVGGGRERVEGGSDRDTATIDRRDRHSGIDSLRTRR